MASVLAINPKYILLDEPTTMIDSKEKENIYQIMQQFKEDGKNQFKRMDNPWNDRWNCKDV